MDQVICPPPSRKRRDDRIVEVFLHAYRSGSFSDNPCWLPQHEKNVEVIATSKADGSRLAIEHTRVFAFDGHMEQEAVLRPIAERIETIHLPELSGRWVQVHFAANFVGRLLQRHILLVQDELVRFLERTLPSVDPKMHNVHHFEVAIPLPNGKSPIVELDVEVWDGVEVGHQISVTGLLPQGRTLHSQVGSALERKLPKLTSADADVRFLMIDMPTYTDSDIAVVKVICDLEGQFPLLAAVDEVVFAKTFGFETEGFIVFRTWSPRSRVWTSSFINARLDKAQVVA